MVSLKLAYLIIIGGNFMNDLFSMVYIEGDILQTFVRLIIVLFAFDCIIGFGNAISTIKGATT